MAIKVGEWYTFEELEKVFGKLEYLSSLSLAINDIWRLTLDYDGRRKKDRLLISAEHKTTKKTWHFEDKNTSISQKYFKEKQK
jgi:hypothetical protein